MTTDTVDWNMNIDPNNVIGNAAADDAANSDLFGGDLFGDELLDMYNSVGKSKQAYLNFSRSYLAGRLASGADVEEAFDKIFVVRI